MAIDSLFVKFPPKKSGGVRLGGRGGQRPCSTKTSPKKSCKKAVTLCVHSMDRRPICCSHQFHSLYSSRTMNSVGNFNNISQKFSSQRTIAPQPLLEQRTKHKPLMNADDFRAMNLGFQHSIFYCFEVSCIYSIGTMFRTFTKCETYKLLYVQNHEQVVILNSCSCITGVKLMNWLKIETTIILSVWLLSDNLTQINPPPLPPQKTKKISVAIVLQQRITYPVLKPQQACRKHSLCP